VSDHTFDNAEAAAQAECRALLARIRCALGREGESLPQAPGVDESIARVVQPDADLLAEFVRSAERVGAQVQVVSPAELRDALRDLLERLNVRRATVSIAPRELERAADSALRGAGVEAADWRRNEGLEAHYDVDAGVTDAMLGIAESGTLVYRAGPHHSRGTCFVPLTHIALLRTDDIVADLIDALARLDTAQAEPPRPTVLISGPSKTADIEGVLVEGVHGPRAVHVFLIRRDSSGFLSQGEPPASGWVGG